MNNTITKYPLLQELLGMKERQLQATYSVRDLAQIFNVSARTIQNLVATGQIWTRDLPGRAKFLNVDLENYLESAARKREQRNGK